MTLLKEIILAWLLHNANTNPVFCYKKQFYEIKDTILRKHGINWGDYDLQHIQKECWTCNGTGIFPYPSNIRTCLRCGGSGNYIDRWIKLNIWHFWKYEFHQPSDSEPLYGKTLEQIYMDKKLSPRRIIDDYISHRAKKWDADCCLILFLLYNPKLFWRAFGRCGFSRKTPIAILFSIGFKLNPKYFYRKIKWKIRDIMNKRSSKRRQYEFLNGNNKDDIPF